MSIALGTAAGLLDPDGHNLRLYFAGRNRLDPPWKVGAKRTARHGGSHSV